MSKALIHPRKTRPWCNQGGEKQWSEKAAKQEDEICWKALIWTPLHTPTPQLFF